MNKNPNRLIPVFFGTLTMTAISVVPIINLLNIFCCAGIMLGGFVGVYVFKKEINDTPLNLVTKDGVLIGVLSGIVSAIIVTGVTMLLAMFTNQNPITEVMRVFQELGTNIPPEIHEQMNRLSDEYNQYGFSPTMTIITLGMNLILYPLFGMLGGVIGVSVFKKKNIEQV